MDGFIFLPVENGEVKNSSFYPEKVKKEEGEESLNFEQFLTPSIFSLGFAETVPVENCSFSSTSTVNGCSSCSPCSSTVVETATPGACTSSNCCNSSFGEILGVEGWKKTIDNFLSEVENISFTLNLGEKGKVLVSGGTGENGEFTFQISGDKEAISELLSRLIDYLVTFLEEKLCSYPVENSSLSGCSLGQGCGGCSNTGGENSILPGNEVENESEFLLINDAPLLGEEGEKTIPVEAVFVPPSNEIENEPVVTEEVTPLEVEVVEEKITPEIPEGLEENASEEVAPQRVTPLEVEVVEEKITPEILEGLEENASEEVAPQKGVAFTSEEEIPSEGMAENMKGYASLEVEEVKSTPREKKVELAPDFYGGTLEKSQTSPVEEVIDFSQVEKNEIPKIFDRILQAASQNGGEKEVVIQLKPESLGSIVIQVREENNRVECVWQISDPRTQEIVTKNLPVLEAHMSEQGMWLNNYMNQNGHYFSYSGKPYYFSPSFSENGEDTTTFSILDNASGKVNVLV